jgi:predicted nucleotidyltransferase
MPVMPIRVVTLAVGDGILADPWRGRRRCRCFFKRNEHMGQNNRIDHDTEGAIQRFLGLIAGHYDMAGAILYGSRARGTHHPDSDADLAVLLKGEHQGVLSTALAMSDAACDVLLETGINITPLPIWLDEWEHPENHSNPALLHNIAKEGVRL